ncbi:MAG: hypothetical protein P8M78_13425 [Myxococcota bacterium]|nr:hypothetical protein [Myxococcota bacterium]
MPTLPYRPQTVALAAPQPREEKILLALGIASGSFGAGAVALWFLLVDAITRVPMFSPSLAGAVVLQGAAPSASVPINLSLVAGFSIVHFLAFAVFGIATTFALHALKLKAASIQGIFMIFMALNAGLLLAILGLAPGIGQTLGWFSICGANAAAAVAMAFCLNAMPKIEDFIHQ